MKPYQVILTVSSALLSCAVVVRPDKKNYTRVVELDNRNVTTSVLETSVSQHPGMSTCSRQCFSNPGCRCLRLRGDECTLYSFYCHSADGGVSDTEPGAVYYSDEDPCPENKGYLSVISPRLCIMLSDNYRSWGQSLVMCPKYGGRLMVIDTQDKCDYIDNFLKNKGKTDAVWIGMRQAEDERFAWMSMEEPNAFSELACPGSQMSAGECGVIKPDQAITNANCESPYRQYICEIPVET